jgi:hypothetical protein
MAPARLDLRRTITFDLYISEKKNSLWAHIKLTSNFVFRVQINKVAVMEYVFHTGLGLDLQCIGWHSRAGLVAQSVK